MSGVWMGFYVNGVFRPAVPGPGTDEQLRCHWLEVSSCTCWVWIYVIAVMMVLHGVFTAWLGKTDQRSQRESPVTAFVFMRSLNYEIIRACSFIPGQQKGAFAVWEAAEGTGDDGLLEHWGWQKYTAGKRGLRPRHTKSSGSGSSSDA